MSPGGTPQRDIRDILVVGHPRSGTGYLAALFRAYGLDVGHEVMGHHGISSWMYAADSAKVPWAKDGSTPAKYLFRHTIHVVRSPLNVISSTVYTEFIRARTMNYMSRYINISPLPLVPEAVKSYIGWNKLIQANAPDVRLRVEEADGTLPEFLQTLGLLATVRPVDDVPSKRHNGRPHRSLTWEDIRAIVDPVLYHELVQYSDELGYPVG